MKLFKCKKCGKLVEILHETNAVTICCGEEMQEVIANTTDAAKEKHVPVITKVDGKMHVQIGEVIHPMDDKHYIEWIMIISPNYCEKVSLKPGDMPVATFEWHDNVEIYTYCNLHGLWKKEI